MTGVEEGSLAPVMRCGSVTSTSGELLTMRARLRSCQRGLLRVAISSRSRARLPRFGSVLGSALGLNVSGMKDAIASKLSFCQGLCVVLESIRRGFRAAVNHRQSAVLLHQQEFQVRALALDGTGNDIA